MDLNVLLAIRELSEKLSVDVMWVRDDLRSLLLEEVRAAEQRHEAQQLELKRLQAATWVLAQLAAQSAGVAPEELRARIDRAIAEVTTPDASTGT